MLIRRHAGFTLIELLVGMALMAIVLAVGMPSLREFSENTKIRTAADNLLAGLQKARVEAIRRNVPAAGPVEFIFTAAAPTAANVNSATASSTGANWMVRVPDTSPPAGTYEFVDGHSANEGGGTANTVSIAGTSATTSAAVTSVYFNSLGQASLNAVSGGGGALNEAGVLLVSNPTASACAHAATPGTMRCLEVRVSISGEVRLCDPKAAVGDSRRC